MKAFITAAAVAVTVLLSGSIYAQTARPIVHHPVKHYKHHKKANIARRGLHLPPPPGKLPPAPRRGKLPAPPPPKLPALPH